MTRAWLSTALAAALALAPLCADAQVTERGFIDGFLTVPASVMTTLGTLLPERSNMGQSYVSSTYDPNLLVTEPATVRVTFLHEGAGYRNSIGYFTYSSDGATLRVLDAQLIFPNASFSGSGGSLATGDTSALRDRSGAVRTFTAGTHIGFFLVSDGWNGTRVAGWDPAAPSLPSTSPATNRLTGSGLYCTIDELNPEQGMGRADVARHFAMVRMAGTVDFLGGADWVAVGIEDLRRDVNSDNDFNDALVLVRSTPEAAVTAPSAVRYDPTHPDPDGDGVLGLDDAYPTDPTRAFVIRTPATQFQTVAFEDNYPNLGDADYNDAVVQYVFEEVTGAAGGLVDVTGTFHLIARGAGFDAAFGVALHGIPTGATGTVRFERFLADGTTAAVTTVPLASRVQLDALGATTLRLDDVFPSTRSALPPTNTDAAIASSPPASARVVIHFDAPIARTPLGAVPFDPYLLVQRGAERYDIHRPGQPSFLDRPSSLRAERGAQSFIDADGYPWVLIVPYDWRFPLESVPIDTRHGVSGAYPTFTTWRGSAGASAPQWYLTPSTTPSAPRVTDPLSATVRTRPWTLAAGN